MEAYLTNFNFSKFVDYRIQPYYTGHRRESQNHMESGTTLLTNLVKTCRSLPIEVTGKNMIFIRN